MDVDSYLKEQKRKGIKLPAAIDPFRNGRVDTSKLESPKEILSKLLKVGQTVFINNHKTVQKAFIPALLTISLVRGSSILPNHWRITHDWKTLVISDRDVMQNFHSFVGDFELTDYLLYDSADFFREHERMLAVLSEEKPKVCVVIVEEVQANTLSKFIRLCRCKSIATVIVSNRKILANLPAPEKWMTVEKVKEQSQFVVEVQDSFSGEKVLTLTLTKEAQGWVSRDVTNEEIDILLERGEIGVQVGINYNEKEF